MRTRISAAIGSTVVVVLAIVFAVIGLATAGAGHDIGVGERIVGAAQDDGLADRIARDPAVAAALESIDAEAIRRHMTLLAADAMEGREAFGDGYLLAARYVAAKFEEFGLRPGADDGGYYQPVRFRRTVPSSMRSSMRISRDGETIEFVFGEDFVAGGSLLHREMSVAAPVVFVGFGVTEPSIGYDDYAGIDAEGKIAAMLAGAPPSLGPQAQAYYLLGRAKQRNAEAHGALGIITIFPPQVPWEQVVAQASRGTLTWIGAGGRPAGASDRLQGSVAIADDAAGALFAGSQYTLQQARAALARGEPRSLDLAIEATIETESYHEDLESPNVVALVPGADVARRGETVVFTAHLDHVGTGQPFDGDSIYNGAYDNASGTAIVLEAARAIASLPTAPRRNVMFAAVTAEEHGLLGSDYLASEPPSTAGEFVANVNLDMVLMLHRPADVVAFGAEHSSLAAVVAAAASLAGLEVSPDPVPQLNVLFRSDQYSFIQQGVPAVMLFPGFTSRAAGVDGAALFGAWMETAYHRPNDEMDQQFDFAVGVEMARLNVLVGLIAANAEERPTWNEGDFFAEKFTPSRATR